MRNPLVYLAILAAISLTSIPAEGEEWTVLGARARGMGGAGVAATNGSDAIYWNPSLVGFGQQAKHKSRRTKTEDSFYDTDVWSFNALTFGLDASIHGNLLADVDAMKDLVDAVNLKTTTANLDAGTNLDPAVINNTFKLLERVATLDKPGKGVTYQVAAFSTLSLGNLGFAAGGELYGAARPVVDLSLAGNTSLSKNGIEKAIDALDTNANGANNVKGDAALTNTATGATQLQASLEAALRANPTLFNANGTVAAGGPFGANVAGLTAAAAANLIVNKIPATVDISSPAFQSAVSTVVTATANNDTAKAAGQTTTGSLDSNGSGFTTRGVALREASMTYAMRVIPRMMSVGMNFRLIEGTTYNTRFTLTELKKGSDVQDQVKDLVEDAGAGDDENNALANSTQGTVDLGAIFQPRPWVRMGWTGRGLIPTEYKVVTARTQTQLLALPKNSPKTFEADPLRVEPQQRVGLAFMPWKWLTLAGDYDVSVNESANLAPFDSQFLAGGMEINLFPQARVLGLALRTGVSKNVAEREAEPTVYHGGIGLRLWLLRIEAAASVPLEGNDKIFLETDANGKGEKEAFERAGASVEVGFNLTF